MSDDYDEWDAEAADRGELPFSRRALLGGAAAVGLGGAAVGLSEVGDDSTGGARADGGANDSLTVAAAHVKRYPVVDVQAWGAEGDWQTDDTEAIRTAVESIEDDGVLYFGPGTYVVSEPIRVDVGSVRAVVGGNAAINVQHDGPAFEVTGAATGGSIPQAIGHLYGRELMPVVEGLQFHGLADPYTGAGLRVRNVFGLLVTDSAFYRLDTGIEFVGKNRNLTVAYNQIWDNRSHAVHWNSCDLHQMLVESNFMGYSDKVLFADRSKLYNLHVTNNDIEGGSGEVEGPTNMLHFDVTDGTLAECKIQGNTIQEHHNVADALVRFENGDADQREAWPSQLRFVDVVNNVLSNSGAAGLVVENATGFRVSDNSFFRFADSVLRAQGRLEDVVVCDNLMADFYLDTKFPVGIVVESPQIRGLAVQNNSISQFAARPLAVRNPENAAGEDKGWEDVRITDNTMRLKFPREVSLEWLDGYALDGYAVDVVNRSSRLDGFTFSGNQVRSREYVKNGVRVDAATVSGAIVTENVVSGPLSGTAYDLPSGDGVVVRDNLPN